MGARNKTPSKRFLKQFLFAWYIMYNNHASQLIIGKIPNRWFLSGRLKKQSGFITDVMYVKRNQSCASISLNNFYIIHSPTLVETSWNCIPPYWNTAASLLVWLLLEWPTLCRLTHSDVYWKVFGTSLCKHSLVFTVISFITVSLQTMSQFMRLEPCKRLKSCVQYCAVYYEINVQVAEGGCSCQVRNEAIF